MFKFLFRPTGLWLGVLGIVMPTYGSSLKKKAFEDNFCGMLLVSHDKGDSYSTATLIATYKSGQESMGLFVTAAHVFVDEKLQVKKNLQATLFLDKDNLCASDEDEKRVQSKRAAIMRVFLLKSMRVPDKYVGTIGDIALATAILPKDCPIRSIPLYDGKGYLKKKNLEALFVTYGRLYGPNAKKKLPMDYKRKVGSTKVTFYNQEEDLYEYSCFRTFLSSTLSVEQMREKGLRIGFTKKGGPETIELSTKDGTKKIFLSPHKKQVNFTKGASGGALVFKTSKGFVIAGVFSQTHTYKVIGSKNPATAMEEYERPLIIHKFEAISTHKWIHEFVKKLSNGERPSLPNNFKELGLICVFETPHKTIEDIPEPIKSINHPNFEKTTHQVVEQQIKEKYARTLSKIIKAAMKLDRRESELKPLKLTKKAYEIREEELENLKITLLEKPLKTVKEEKKKTLQRLSRFLKEKRISQEILSGKNGLGLALHIATERVRPVHLLVVEQLLLHGANPNLPFVNTENNSIITPLEMMLNKMLDSYTFLFMSNCETHFWMLDEKDGIIRLLADYGAKLGSINEVLLMKLQNKGKEHGYGFPYQKIAEVFETSKHFVDQNNSLLVSGYVRRNYPNLPTFIIPLLVLYLIYGRLV